MTSLYLHELPLSLSYTADNYVLGTDLLNPVNAGQGVISRVIGKPIRAVTRLIYETSISRFLALAGALYHTGEGITYKAKALLGNGDPALKNKYSKLALEHFKAAWTDFSAISMGYLAILSHPSILLPRYAPIANVKIEDVKRENTEWIDQFFQEPQNIDHVIATQQGFNVKKMVLAAAFLREFETKYKRFHNDFSHTPLRPLNDRCVLIISLRGDRLLKRVFGEYPDVILEKMNHIQF